MTRVYKIQKRENHKYTLANRLVKTTYGSSPRSVPDCVGSLTTNFILFLKFFHLKNHVRATNTTLYSSSENISL